MIHDSAPIAAFSIGHLTVGRVIIAAFMVALLLGPRRWMLWASSLRGRRSTLAPPDAPGPSAAPGPSGESQRPDRGEGPTPD